MTDADADVARVAGWVREATRIVVLTGAGISTDSGIPDFRGPQGVWTKNPAAEKASTLEHYLADPDVRRAAWQNRLHSPAWTAEPNAGHRAVVELQRRQQLLAVVTQNIDELHQRAGIDPDRVVEVHGTMRWTRCWTCDDRRPMQEALDRVEAGEGDPDCLACRPTPNRGAGSRGSGLDVGFGTPATPGASVAAFNRGGVLKSDTISFGQSLVPQVIDRAMEVSGACDVLLAVGSTLSVYPAANCVPIAVRAGAHVAIVNGSPTEMDHLADVVLRGPIGELLPEVVATAAR